MNRPMTTMPKRARSTSVGCPRSEKEAAIRLVRIEFDLSRLRLGIDQAETRVRSFRQELKEKESQKRALLERIVR